MESPSSPTLSPLTLHDSQLHIDDVQVTINMPILSPPSLISLPLENTQHIICFCSPLDIARISQTCKILKDAIYSHEGKFVWKSVFLQIWDDPRVRTFLEPRGGWFVGTKTELESALVEVEFHWQKEFQNRIWASTIISNRSRASEATCAQRKDALKILLSIIHSAYPQTWKLVPGDDNYAHSKNLEYVLNALREAHAVNHSVWPALSSADIQDSQKIPDFQEFELRSELHALVCHTDDAATEALEEGLPSEDLSAFGHHFHHPGAPPEILFNFDLQGPSVRNFNPFPADLIRQRRQSISRPTIATLRSVARAFVYNLQNYGTGNLYGPLLSDLQGGYKANWRHLEYLMIVILCNLKEPNPLIPTDEPEPGEEELPTRRKSFFPKMELDALRPWSAPGFEAQFKAAMEWETARLALDGDVDVAQTDDPRHWKDWDDWAGVEGRWRRVVSFMDYVDLSRFNWPPHRRERDPTIFEEPDFMEATRVLNIDIRITRIEHTSTARPLSAAAIRLNRPRIYFSGTSSTQSNVSWGSGMDKSYLSGYVECLASEDIRWYLVSSYGGQERWSSQGVQIGGVGSARGVLGTWTGVHHEHRDPVGPFWFWKVAGREALPDEPPATRS